MSTTGVAGPDPQDGHPVGQVFVAVTQLAESNVAVRELASVGDRAAIRRQAVRSALELLADLLGMPIGPDCVEEIGET
jgi:nicotinamide-nucleotide amidase